MALGRKDVTATVLTVLAVGVFAANHQGWNVPLVGDSTRWAAGAVILLGVFTCGLGSPENDAMSKWLGVLGAFALGLAVFAVVSESLTVLSLLVVDIVLLWAASTMRHAAHRHEPHSPATG